MISYTTPLGVTAAPDPPKVVSALVRAHHGFIGDWRPISRYLNSLVPLTQLVSEPGGKLASGPASLLAAYAEALDSFGIRTSMIDAGVPKRWDDERQWADIDRNVTALVFSGWNSGTLPGTDPDSYVIARQFEAQEILPPAI